MRLLKIWALKIFFVFIFFCAIQSAIVLFMQDSFSFTYFQFLNAFHPPYAPSYLLTIARIIINILNCLPLYLAIHNRPILKASVWKTLFFLKIIFDLFGHPLEIKNFITIYYSNPSLSFLILAISIMTQIPWYFFLFYYAFRNKKMFDLLKQ